MSRQFLFVTSLLILFCWQLACTSPQSRKADQSARVSQSHTFTQEYHQWKDGNLLLACLVIERELNGHLRYDSGIAFEDITLKLQSLTDSGRNVDSVINAFVAAHTTVDFQSSKVQAKLAEFMSVMEVVERGIFGKIDSDDDAPAIKELEGKILQIPEVTTIYRHYVQEGMDMSDLHYSTSYGMDIQLAYYLYQLDIGKRNEVIRRLL